MRGLLKDVSNALGVNNQTVLRHSDRPLTPTEWNMISTTLPETQRSDAPESPQEPQEAASTTEQEFPVAEETERSERQFAPVERFMSGDIWTWLHDVGDRVFRYWTYRRMFTPYEKKNAFMDESWYESPTGSLGIIKECVVLPNNDILIGFLSVNDDDDYDLPPYIDYRRLSEISLAYSAIDQRELED